MLMGNGVWGGEEGLHMHEMEPFMLLAVFVPVGSGLPQGPFLGEQFIST